MFTIIGGDGKEYGPVTADQIRGWIRAGRVNLDTQAKALGDTDWRRVGDFVEFLSPDGAPPMLDSAAAANTEGTLAHPAMRLLAAFIDGFIESLCWLPTSQAILKSFGGLLSAGQVSPQEIAEAIMSGMPRSFPYLAALILVQAALLTLRGQTIGKMLTGLRIVRARDGAPAGFLHAFLLRGFLPRCFRHVPFIGLLFWLVDNCFIFRADRRCLHDLIAGTKVVKL